MDTASQALVRDTLEDLIRYHRRTADCDNITMTERGESTAFLNMVHNYYAQLGNRKGIVASLYTLITPQYEERARRIASQRGRQDELLNGRELLLNLSLLFGGLYCFKEVAIARLVHDDPATAIAYGLPGLTAFGSIIAVNYFRLRRSRRQQSTETGQDHPMTRTDVTTVLDAYADAIQASLSSGSKQASISGG